MDGGLRLPNRPATDPSYTAPPAFVAICPPVPPHARSWQAAHGWLRLRERLASLKMDLPSCSCGESSVGLPLPPQPCRRRASPPSTAEDRRIASLAFMIDSVRVGRMRADQR